MTRPLPPRPHPAAGIVYFFAAAAGIVYFFAAASASLFDL
jgi:hypothetical protein